MLTLLVPGRQVYHHLWVEKMESATPTRPFGQPSVPLKYCIQKEAAKKERSRVRPLFRWYVACTER